MSAPASIQKTAFGTTADGQPVELFTVSNANGLAFRCMTYGAIITEIDVPDRNGVLQNVVCGFDTLKQYEAPHPYFGALVGRFCNRIGGARFSLGGKDYPLAKNDGPNCLHGGLRGFDKQSWRATPLLGKNERGVRFTRVSPDGEEGFPGTLSCSVSYRLTDDNALIFEYAATTDAPTPCNLTQHSYFNLSGDFSKNIYDTRARFRASAFTPTDAALIPTGERRPVAGTPFDFTAEKPVGRDIEADDAQLRGAGGYDHNFIADKAPDALGEICAFYEPTSGRTLTIASTEPGFQFYTGNFLDGTLRGQQGVPYARRCAFALETQHFPDSPNRPEFPSCILNPGETYASKTVLTFGTR